MGHFEGLHPFFMGKFRKFHPFKNISPYIYEFQEFSCCTPYSSGIYDISWTISLEIHHFLNFSDKYGLKKQIEEVKLAKDAHED